MSEISVKGLNALIVNEVEIGSPADRAGSRPGDLIRNINGRPILDVLDYRFHAADARLNVLGERDGAPIRLLIHKSEGEDAGLTFEQELGDRIHTCNNKCVFCFIHQMPKKMRRSLYLMDDDFRLSFMHGNYVTLTNLSGAEWARILEQRLSPLYVSVHATDPELRQSLLGRKEPTPILPQLRELAANGIDVHAQIVLCPGLNDGDALDRTLTELAAEHPSVAGKRCGVLSVAIVPIGMTRFRERLPKLVHVEEDYARRMIAHVTALEQRFRSDFGTRFAWLADEWYFLAGSPFPGRAHYEGFPQLEDGIGTVRLFMDEARRIARLLPERAHEPISATLVTAEMPAPLLHELANTLNSVIGVDVNVLVVRNDFFGGDIRISGLLTATDILAAVKEFPDCRGTIYIPTICLRDGELFLDDVSIDQARRGTGLDLRVVAHTPRALAEALGLLTRTRRTTSRPGWVMEERVTA